jgi:hypothetical protein
MAIEPDPTLKRFDDFTAELDEIERHLRQAVEALDKARPEHHLRAHQAEWHIQGTLYHCRRLLACYQEVADGVAGRVIGTGAAVVVMYAPAVQRMWFEFYALVNLARITLDNLRNLLAPVFTTEFGQLPKSISGFLDGGTDCPVYVWLGKQPVVKYLSDMRNCITHFRSFATGDNAVITNEGLKNGELLQGVHDSDWLRPMAKGVFRRVGDTGVSMNFYLPDVIFDRSGKSEKLSKFTYQERYNILSQSLAFVQLVSGAVAQSFVLLLEPGKAAFHYKKRKT